MGWYSDPDTTEEYNSSQIIVEDITLYAKWEITKYSVTFITDGGTAINAQTVEHGKTASKPSADPEKQNCVFKGWFTSAAATTQFDFTKAITASTTVYAGWEFNGWVVRFNTNGAGTIDSQVVLKDGTQLVDPPQVITKNHYSFGGWYEDSSFVTPFDFNTAPTEDKNLYAKWTPEKYNISFWADGAYLPGTTADYDTTITLPTAPAKAHYTFDGWYTDGQNYKTQFTESTKVSGDTILYAKYSPIMWTVTFNTYGGSSVDAVKIMDGEVFYDFPYGLTKTGYTFDGWYTDENCTSGNEAQAQNVYSDITLYAKWNINYYTVEFISNGGTYVNSQSVAYDSTVTKPDDPTLNHQVFGGWYTDAALKTAYNFSSKVTKNMTLYAKWTDLMRTVTFNSKGGSSVTAVKVKDGQVITQMPASPTKQGHVFVGWYTDESLDDYTAFDQGAAIQSDITLFAKWRINTYQVFFDSKGGSDVNAVIVDWNTTVAEPAAPTKAHMIFGGWYSNEALTKAFSFNTKITADTVLYAKWTVVERKITFNTNGGSPVGAIKFNEGTTVTKPANPVKEGHVFADWYTDQALTTSFDFAKDSEDLTSDITLYAKWNINTYKVTFNSNGGSDVDTATVDWNTTVTAPAAPTKAHMNFGGWYSDETLAYAFNFSTTIKADTTLYAKWTPVKRTIKFNTNGGNSISDVIFNEGTTATRPDNPVKENAVFVGWYADEALTTPFNFTADSSKLTENITLYAKWKEYSLSVSVKAVKQSDYVVTVDDSVPGQITFKSQYDGMWYVDVANRFWSTDEFVYETTYKGTYIISQIVKLDDGSILSYTAEVEVK